MYSISSGVSKYCECCYHYYWTAFTCNHCLLNKKKVVEQKQQLSVLYRWDVRWQRRLQAALVDLNVSYWRGDILNGLLCFVKKKIKKLCLEVSIQLQILLLLWVMPYTLMSCKMCWDNLIWLVCHRETIDVTGKLNLSSCCRARGGAGFWAKPTIWQ